MCKCNLRIEWSRVVYVLVVEVVRLSADCQVLWKKKAIENYEYGFFFFLRCATKLWAYDFIGSLVERSDSSISRKSM
jgi:hypothetical protein